MIDLHCHSTFSDGLLTPEALVQHAYEQGVRTLALTDHDTVEGVSILQNIPVPPDMICIAGIELSVSWRHDVIHILGLDIDPATPALLAIINEQREKRLARAQTIAEKLTSLNIPDLLHRAAALSTHGNIARPHFARVLVEEGVARDTAAAFKTYLKRGRIGYVPTEWMTLEMAIAIIHQAHGLAVLAHPCRYKLSSGQLLKLLERFKAAGGDGMEVLSGSMDANSIARMTALSHRFALLASSGSDFHGYPLSKTGLGKQGTLPLNCNPVWHSFRTYSTRGL